jgi:DNA polymerase
MGIGTYGDMQTPPKADKPAPRKSDPQVKRLLEIRQELSKASTAKYKALINGLDGVDHIRSLLMYHGAGTGRWTAKRFQPQNLPSRGLAVDAEGVDGAIAAAKVGLLEELYSDVMGVASACIRGMLIASPGHRFISADFSAIEGRVLAWMAGEEHVLQAYVEGKRLYCVAAAGIYKVPYEEINEGRKHDPKYKKMDSIGKVIELACGYQGSVGAFKAMAEGYGVEVPEDEAKEAIYAWRESRPLTVALWRGMEQAAIEAVMSPGTVTTYQMVKFKVIGKYLLMKLPSGRFLYYFNPNVEEKEMPWKDDQGNPCYKDCVSYWAVDSYTKKWSKCWGYGGLWTENAVQAVARDLMASAMLRVEAAGYPVVLTVHDELVSEAPVDHGSVEDYVKIMCDSPAWAAGCPVAAEGWSGPRYRK